MNKHPLEKHFQHSIFLTGLFNFKDKEGFICYYIPSLFKYSFSAKRHMLQ